LRPTFIRAAAFEQLLANGRSAAGEDIDPPPLVKLFTPDANATGLISELDPSDRNRASRLCDLSLGVPELGYASLAELASVRGSLGVPVELDVSFVATEPLSIDAETARAAGGIAAASFAAVPVTAMVQRMTCERCGSDDVARDACLGWDVDSQSWRLTAVFYYAHGHACEGETLQAQDVRLPAPSEDAV
jgi:hypothetical protein